MENLMIEFISTYGVTILYTVITVSCFSTAVNFSRNGFQKLS